MDKARSQAFMMKVVADLAAATAEALVHAGALWGLRGLRDANTQRKVATMLALLTTLGTAVTASGALSGAVNAMGWSSVAAYGFFIVAWDRLAVWGGAGSVA